MKLRNSRSGFTLIELIIYIGLAAMIIVALLNGMLRILGTREKVEVLHSVQQEVRFVMDRISVAIRDAQDINTGTSTFDNDNGVLSLAMSGSAINPTVFSLSSNRVQISEGGAGAVPLTSTGILIDQLRFTNLTAPDTYGTVKIQIHGTDAVSGSDDKTYVDEITLTTSISLRQ